jgi:UDP-3-O-[3-hydroxymyristoyl] glucosamine N-acyltransferase
MAVDSPPLEDTSARRAAALLKEKQMQLGELIEKLGGKLVQGSPQLQVIGVNSAALAGATDLTFAEDAASAAQALAGSAGAVVLRAGLAPSSHPSKCIVEAPQPRLWFARASRLLRPAPACQGIHPAAILAESVRLAANVTIGAGAVLADGVAVGAGTRIDTGAVIGEGVSIGNDCRIYPRAVIYAGTTIGHRVVVHAGAVLGADGFGYVRDLETGSYTQFPQQGTLVIEDDVEIGANSTIDRGALAETRIRRGAKFDNLVHVGHNCDIGEDAILVALTGVSGSSTIGKGAVLAGQVGIGDHAHVGPGVILGGQSGVFSGKSVSGEGLPPGTVLYGTPARPLRQVLREQAVLTRLAAKKSNRQQ